jgi:hypothetical protein
MNKLPRFDGDKLLLSQAQFDSLSMQITLGEKHYRWSSTEATYRALIGIGIRDDDIQGRMFKETKLTVVLEAEVGDELG